MADEVLDWIPVKVEKDTRIAAEDGTFTVILKAGEPTSIPYRLLPQALALGAVTTNGVNALNMSDEEVVNALIEAMIDILDAGDPAHVTDGGEPRYAALKARCPAFTKDQRERAWATVLDGRSVLYNDDTTPDDEDTDE